MTQTTQIIILCVVIWLALGCALMSSLGMLNPFKTDSPGSLGELENAILRSRPVFFAALLAIIQAVLILAWPLLLLWALVTFDYPYWFHRLTSHPLRECTEDEFAEEDRQ